MRSLKEYSLLLSNIQDINPAMVIMWIIGSAFLWMGFKKHINSAFFISLGFCVILVNFPDTFNSGIIGTIRKILDFCIESSFLVPVILLLTMGFMLDFDLLFSKPKTAFIGAVSQIGTFLVIGVSAILGFPVRDALCSGLPGTADAPVSIIASQYFSGGYKAALAVTPYICVMALPYIQSSVIMASTTKKERMIKMKNASNSISLKKSVICSLAAVIILSVILPESGIFIGALMFGNIIKKSEIFKDAFSRSGDYIYNILTVLLGISVSYYMQWMQFLRMGTFLIIGLGLLACTLNCIFGVLFIKILNIFTTEGNKLNPMIGAAAISGFPVASQSIQRISVSEDFENHLIHHAAGINAIGSLSSAVAGGIIISMLRIYGV